jgi:hypothetical protein
VAKGEVLHVMRVGLRLRCLEICACALVGLLFKWVERTETRECGWRRGVYLVLPRYNERAVGGVASAGRWHVAAKSFARKCSPFVKLCCFLSSLSPSKSARLVITWSGIPCESESGSDLSEVGRER